MRKIILLLTLLFSTLSFAQLDFEKGYFIHNSGQKTDCLIKNMDWKNNPTAFDYKLNESSEVLKGTIKEVQLFAIQGKATYIKTRINVDKSSDNVNKLSNVRAPEYVPEEVFLKHVVQGNANLYKYNDKTITRYYIQMGDAAIEPLVYKKYFTGDQKIAHNETYKYQLESSLKCVSISDEAIRKMEYKEKALTDLFIKYNQCSNPDYVTTSKETNHGSVHLNIRPRINSTALNFSNTSTNASYDMGTKTGFGIGLEVNYILPFNTNKWALIFEPTYQSFQSENIIDVTYVSGGKLVTNVEYKSIELPLGIRHYMFINPTSKVFINAQYVFDVSMDSSTEFKRMDDSIFNTLAIKSRPNIALGAGYSYDKYGVELRYFTKRNVLADYDNWDSEYKNISLILSYTFL
jgi:hypothetical protein